MNETLASIPYPKCIPKSTYGLTQFWAEEYWAFNELEKLTVTYPQFDFTGLINTAFRNYLSEIIEKDPHIKIKNTKSYRELPMNIWEIGREKLNLATSHAPSYLKAKEYYREYQDNLRIINIDAHMDIGEFSYIHGAWLTKDLARVTTLIGGWSETSEDLQSSHSILPFQSSKIEVLEENPFFQEWLSRKKVYITIDLDFFPLEDGYLGLSSYWHRNLFIGHTFTINQRIQKFIFEKNRATNVSIGKVLNIFHNLPHFYKQKVKSIETQINQLIHLLTKLTTVCQSNSVTLLGVDFVEYSPLCDWKQLTIRALIRKFQCVQKLVESV